MTRGYFGIGIENCKSGVNVGTLWRSAHNLGASFIFTIGNRYRFQGSDTTKAWRSIPLFQYPTFDAFYGNLPHDCQLVGIEFPHEKAKALPEFMHPDRCVYLLGAEDPGLFADDLEAVQNLTNRIVAVRDGMSLATPRTLVQVGQLEIASAPSLSI